MRSICIDPLVDPQWLGLLDRFPSDVFHSPGWLRVLAETYGWRARAQVLLDDRGEAVAGVPFVQVGSLFGVRIAALPFSDYCDPLVRDHEQWHSLAGALMGEHCSAVTLRCLHTDIPLRDARFSLAKQARWHGLDLGSDLDVLWDGLDSGTRRAIKKAEREGVIVRPARDTSELRAFYTMHLSIRKRKYRLLAQPFCFFERIWRHFVEPGDGVLLLAVHQGEIIGGTLYLAWKGRLYYKFNASLPASLSYRPNDLLVWEGIRHARETGHGYLDFGLSDWDEDGLIRFKRKFASEEKAISFLRHLPARDPHPQDGPDADLLPQLTTLFTDDEVPDRVTERAGEVLYRFFA